ncbi:mandelate racemase/muconate lactonizing enzyme family protein [Streptomyces sp. TS71-3]|uniref:mandelate racemase/muconate lactonizing enzyme family protein n=1 Tax=Streptomyces sp. TS71-3 TaxID=2733862 RepID=UPI001B0CB71D|nr:enolase C-terminal domain-like protein [Streptomyces sp. TS71-3]GHJ40426.1 mandelate racemase [Streptomyces sp. TS71-3]
MSRIAAVDVLPVDVPFARRFVLGSGAVGTPERAGTVVFVKVTTEDGVVGWGEQRALPSWSYETAETIAVVIARHLAPLLIGLTPFDVELFHSRAARALSPAVSNGFPFARAAVDIALHDAAGKLAGLPVHALLGGRTRDEIPLCSAIGVGSPDAVREHARGSAAYHAYKVKVGGDPAADSACVRAVAEVADGKPLWLDANQSYRPAALRRLVDAVRDVPGLHSLEQPVPSTDTLAMRRLRRLVDLPIAVDEGSFTAQDLARVIALDAADLVVVKICKSGGIRAALKTAQVALAGGLELLASGLTDCGVGFAAALHLFSQLDLALPAELNGPELLADLYVDGLVIEDAVARVPTGPGLGVQVDEERLRAEAHDALSVRAPLPSPGAPRHPETAVTTAGDTAVPIADDTAVPRR